MANITYDYEIYDFVGAGKYPCFLFGGGYFYYTLMYGLARTENGGQLIVPFASNTTGRFVNLYEEAEPFEQSYVEEYLVEDGIWLEKERFKAPQGADLLRFTHNGVEEVMEPMFYYMRDDEEVGYRLVPFLFLDGRVRDLTKIDPNYTGVIHNTHSP